MKKLTIAALVAFSLPMMAANAAAPADLKNRQYNLTGTLKLKSSGLCYGMKFKGSGKADPVLLPISATLLIGASDQAGGLTTWSLDSLMPVTVPATTFPGGIATRKGNKLTIAYAAPEQKALALGLLTKASNVAGPNASFQNLVNNATVATYTVTKASTDAKGSKMKLTDVSVVKSFDGPCVAEATVTRTFTGVHFVP